MKELDIDELTFQINNAAVDNAAVSKLRTLKNEFKLFKSSDSTAENESVTPVIKR